MHYYQRNIGDYHKKAGRLTMLEHGAYTLLMDACYDRERFPTREEAIEWCWARSPDEVAAVDFVLTRFFTKQDDGTYAQGRIKEELTDYLSKEGRSSNAKDAKKQRAQERQKRFRDERAAMFEVLRRNAVTPAFNTSQKELRELCKPFLNGVTLQDALCNADESVTSDAVTQNPCYATTITINHKPITNNQITTTTGDAVTPVTPPALNGRFPMHGDWVPDSEFDDQLYAAGAGQVQWIRHLDEFTLYWRSRPEAIENHWGWQNKFLKAIIRSVEHEKSMLR